MTSVLFDTLKFANRLQAGGFTPEQASTASAAFSEGLGEWLSNQPLATKSDVDSVRLAVRDTSRDIEAARIESHTNLETLRAETKANFATLDLKLRETELRIIAQQKDLLLRIGGMIVALGAILIAIKYFG